MDRGPGRWMEGPVKSVKMRFRGGEEVNGRSGGRKKGRPTLVFV